MKKLFLLAAGLLIMYSQYGTPHLASNNQGRHISITPYPGFSDSVEY